MYYRCNKNIEKEPDNTSKLLTGLWQQKFDILTFN